MSDPQDELMAIERATRELLPLLTERLARHGLGEIEVRQGELRLRVSAAGGATSPPQSAPASGAASGTAPHQAGAAAPPGAADGGSVASERASTGGNGQGDAGGGSAEAGGAPLMAVASPAVGYFIYADGLGPGLEVERGSPLGYVDVLGVRHEVRAPRTGIVRGLAAESGEAVEYGQTLIEVEA